jgi:hypothetical protein
VTRARWLRFIPDYGAVPALWHLDRHDVNGPDLGLADDLLELLSPTLISEITAWLDEWAGQHEQGGIDSPQQEWVAAGHSVLSQLRGALEPRGYRIISWLEQDFRNKPSRSRYRRMRRAFADGIRWRRLQGERLLGRDRSWR